MIGPIALSILGSSQVGEARRKAIALAGRLGFNETQQGKVGIVVTEVANNLVQHAKDGLLLLQSKFKNDIAGLEIIALDSGPGMANIDECWRDGFSTGETPGNGLGAITRLSAFVDVYSMPNLGTAIVAQHWATPSSNNLLTDKLELGVVCLPKTGEEISGDAWATYQQTHRSLLLVADGLGHGPQAAQASSAAVRIFQENTSMNSAAIVEAAHRALRSTRGAAMAIAEVDFEYQTVHYTGVGNIASTILTAQSRHSMVSHNGTIGHDVRKIHKFSYPWSKEAVLIMHSDGLKTHWQLERYPGLLYKHPSLIAAILYRDFNRGRDDVTVLVARERQ